MTKEQLEAAAPALLEATKDWLMYAEECLSEFDVTEGEGLCNPWGEEELCPECMFAGCIQQKILGAREAIRKAGE